MNIKKLAVTLVVALALVLSVGTASLMGETPSASACEGSAICSVE
jgi:hypothetical protein